MSTALFTSCCFALRNDYPRRHVHVRRAAATGKCGRSADKDSELKDELLLRRRKAMVSGLSLVSSVALGFPGEGLAVKQGLLAGRIPGLSEPDENGWRTYRRPDDKSGGHGVGWSPIIPYIFKVPSGWEEVPVSIADLGGTEIDLRFANSKEGRLFVIVAPVLRFSDLGGEATIEKIGSPERVINAFGPEVIGENVEGKVLSMEVAEHSGKTYYQYELEPPHIFITATAAGNRLYLFNVTANGYRASKGEDETATSSHHSFSFTSYEHSTSQDEHCGQRNHGHSTVLIDTFLNPKQEERLCPIPTHI